MRQKGIKLSFSDRFRADLMLLIVALIWGSAFSAQRVAAAHLGFLLFNGFRFILGACTVFLFIRGDIRNVTKVELQGGVLAGTVLIIAATLQHAGLRYTTAGKAGFITGLYVVLVPLILTLVWKRVPPWYIWAASFLASIGMYFLSAEGQLQLSVGDFLELLGAVMWAFHVILIGKYVRKADGLRFAFIQYVVCGSIGILAGLIFEFDTLVASELPLLSILYTGIVSVGLGYTLQVMGQKHAPESDAAIILSLEAVFSVIFGWILLGETLTSKQIMGCGIIMLGMILAQIPSLLRRKTLKSA